MAVHNIEKLKDRRRKLRQTETEEENILWLELRNNKIGHKFKRQHSIGGYILDFYCSKLKLIIELDGPIHQRKENKEYDKVRDGYFSDLGYTTIRFLNSDIRNNLVDVLHKIKSFLTSH
jgi:very-short-patch-repair endonuclease